VSGHPVATRWLTFNLVGVAGFMIQLLTLAAATRLGVGMSLAVPLAVLVAVSHNFVWHERVTWPGQRREQRMRRWLSFNLSTGLVSVVTNVVVTTLLVALTAAPLLVANAAAVVIASVVNFLVSDRYVFSRGPQIYRRFPAENEMATMGVTARPLLTSGVAAGRTPADQ
jgi:putative flippase GtrA